MKSRVLLVLVTGLMLMLLSACPMEPKPVTLTLYVQHFPVSNESASMQYNLQVRKLPSGEWFQLPVANLANFSYVPGRVYTLRVKINSGKIEDLYAGATTATAPAVLTEVRGEELEAVTSEFTIVLLSGDKKWITNGVDGFYLFNKYKISAADAVKTQLAGLLTSSTGKVSGTFRHADDYSSIVLQSLTVE